MLEQVEKNIVQYQLIQKNDKIVVGVSGGPDSMCLLDVLIRLQDRIREEQEISYTLVVAHVNHMIREEAIKEKEYVEKFCKKYHLPFYYLEEDVPQNAKKEKMSEETYGRKVRYEFFEEIVKKEKATLMATAHHMDDDIETIFLNIIRGTGLKGLTRNEVSLQK